MTADIETLYHTLHKPLRVFFYNRVNDWQVAEDLTHDVYLKALAATKRGNGQREPGKEATWIWQIANNVLRDYYQYIRFPKRWAAGGLLSWEDAEESLPIEGPDTTTESRFEWETVERALHSLTPEQAHFMALTLEGWEPVEIARLTGAPHGAVRASLHRSRMKLVELTRFAG